MPLQTDNIITVVTAGTDSTLASIGKFTTYGGVLSSIGAWLVSSTGAAVIGILGVVFGIMIQWYFKSREDKRKQEEHVWRREEHIARIAMISKGNLKASPQELLDNLKKTTSVPEVPIEESIANVLTVIK